MAGRAQPAGPGRRSRAHPIRRKPPDARTAPTLENHQQRGPDPHLRQRRLDRHLVRRARQDLQHRRLSLRRGADRGLSAASARTSGSSSTPRTSASATPCTPDASDVGPPSAAGGRHRRHGCARGPGLRGHHLLRGAGRGLHRHLGGGDRGADRRAGPAHARPPDAARGGLRRPLASRPRCSSSSAASRTSSARPIGGINYIEMFDYPHASVSQIQVPNAIWWELERRLALIYLGKSHSSSRGARDGHPRAGGRRAGVPPSSRTCARPREASRDAVYAGDFAALGQAMIDNTEAQARLHPDLVSAGRPADHRDRPRPTARWAGRSTAPAARAARSPSSAGALQRAKRAMIREIEEDKPAVPEHPDLPQPLWLAHMGATVRGLKPDARRRKDRNSALRPHGRKQTIGQHSVRHPAAS